jgi:uncharacterized membrane protein
MDIRDRRGLQSAARSSLNAASFSPKYIIALHAGLIALLSAVLLLLDFLLEQQIGNTGGLSAIGRRSMLETAQSFLRMIQSVALPFWSMGYLFATLQWAKKSPVQPMTLLEGFRRFGAVLRLELLQILLYSLIAVLCSYAAAILFFMTPWAKPFMDTIMPQLTEAADAQAIQAILLSAGNSVLIPIFVIFGVIFAAISIPIFYRFRMAAYVLMDTPGTGAFAALRSSVRLMRGNCLALVRLDLHFWWFYLLDILVSALCYGDLILSGLGIPLPVSAEVGYFLFVLLSLGAQLALYIWKRNDDFVTYAHAYYALKPTLPTPDRRVI